MRDVDPPPEYLRGVEGIPDELAELADQSEHRRLTPEEEQRLDAAITEARQRFDWARLKRDGRLQ